MTNVNEEREDLRRKVDELYEGLSPYEIRECVIQACQAFVIDLSIADIVDMKDIFEIGGLDDLDRERREVWDVKFGKERGLRK